MLPKVKEGARLVRAIAAEDELVVLRGGDDGAQVGNVAEGGEECQDGVAHTASGIRTLTRALSTGFRRRVATIGKSLPTLSEIVIPTNYKSCNHKLQTPLPSPTLPDHHQLNHFSLYVFSLSTTGPGESYHLSNQVKIHMSCSKGI